tara:strand:+ start:1611 stop:2216 length:606 start_codon:yes stop_codon:yes gene_type:complete
MFMKKAAMFGLDARIALAIFGALSVISGAALYSAIQQAKATSFITEMREIAKAWEQYYLDTGVSLAQHSSDSSNIGGFHRLKTNHLVSDSGVSGWNGPYLSYKPNTSSELLYHNTYGDIYIFLLNSAAGWNSWSSGYCKSGESCFNWVLVNGIGSDSLAKSMDAILDDSDGFQNGDFRWRNYNTGVWEYYLKVMPTKNPRD